MTVGMLWFDNSKDDLAKKINRAREYYLKKYGQHPSRCYIHPTMTTDAVSAGTNVYGVEIRISRQVLPNHFWLSNEERL